MTEFYFISQNTSENNQAGIEILKAPSVRHFGVLRCDHMLCMWGKMPDYFHGSVQGCGNSTADALELPQPCTEPSV